MMPTQVEIIPITDRQHEYARKLHEQLEAAGIRVETDYRSEKMGYKIREAQLKKIPYMLVVGDKEMEEGLVAVRARKEEKAGVMTVDAFLAQILKEIATKER
jgi:threonyl-tRNA synthetase